jgi:ubiquinone/menaquinone biosynthesis C-methylase UbiE
VNHVLDLGTGTGIWAMDFADEHPEAEVHAARTILSFALEKLTI